MADERDPKVSQRYRELGGEGPSRELDQSILAAAHRAADKPHAPLVTPAGRHRWYFAFGAVAILVLAVAVTVQVERLQPDPEAVTVTPVPPARKEDFFYKDKEAPPPPVEQRRRLERADPQKRPSPESPVAESRVQENAARAVAPAEVQSAPLPAPSTREDSRGGIAIDGPVSRAEPKPAPAQSSQPESREQSPAADAVRQEGLLGSQMRGARIREAAPVARPAPAPAPQAARAPQAKALESQAAAIAIPLSPERLLERIAELRKEGRHNEADQALAEFRQRYPDYRIPKEMLEKVERKK